MGTVSLLIIVCGFSQFCLDLPQIVDVVHTARVLGHDRLYPDCRKVTKEDLVTHHQLV